MRTATLTFWVRSTPAGGADEAPATGTDDTPPGAAELPPLPAEAPPRVAIQTQHLSTLLLFKYATQLLPKNGKIQS